MKLQAMIAKATASVLAFCLAQQAWAADANDQPVSQANGSEAAGAEAEGIGDIAVTAQKRSESAQRIPLAITAVRGEELASRQITDFEKRAPSLPKVNFSKNVGFARIAIRGLGFDSTTAGQEGRGAYHTDGVFISRPTAQLASFSISTELKSSAGRNVLDMIVTDLAIFARLDHASPFRLLETAPGVMTDEIAAKTSAYISPVSEKERV